MKTPCQSFTSDHLATLREEYATIKTAPTSCLDRFHAIFDGCSDGALLQLVRGKINFVSSLAVNACVRRKVALPAYRITYDDGTAQVSSMSYAVDLETARNYYLGQRFVDEDAKGGETARRVVSVEPVNDSAKLAA